jgi:hypothetical protein
MSKADRRKMHKALHPDPEQNPVKKKRLEESVPNLPSTADPRAKQCLLRTDAALRVPARARNH